MAEKKRVVILGAGFGGLVTTRALSRLQKKLKKKLDFDLTLIDRSGYQLFTPDLYEVASANSGISNEQNLRDAICLDVRRSIKWQQVRFFQSEIMGVDPERQVVSTSEGEVNYDILVVALGSEAFYFDIPGMEENSVPMKTIDDALRIRSRIHELLAKNPDAHMVICGGGPAGVELAAELRKACASESFGSCPAITIVEGKDRILPMFPERVTQVAEHRLVKELGIRLKTGFFIAEAKADRVVSTEGDELSADIIIWAGGVKASSVLEKTGLELTKRKQVANQPTLQTRRYKNIFVIGDAAETKDTVGLLSPMTAHEAVHQGPTVAKNIIALLLGNPLQEYRMKDEGYVITLGGKKGMVVLPSGRVISGYVGWFIRKFVDFRHFRSLLPFTEALSIWYHGTRLMIKNDRPQR